MKKLFGGAFGFSVLIFTTFAFAAQTLSLKSIGFPPDFQVQSDYYTVDPKVEFASDPGFLIFKVKASFAEFTVEGLLPFKKLLHEIQVIEMIKRDQAGTGFVDGAVDSVKTTGKGAVNLVVHPINSVKGMGSATAELGRSIGSLFRKKQEGEKTSLGETIMGSAKRDVANKLGVDVYSDNPYLQELIDKMAKTRMTGQGAVFVAKLLIPLALVVSVALTVSGLNGSADLLVNDKSKSDLFYENRKALEALGFSEKDTFALLNIPFYTPREATYMRFYLQALQNVIGYREILKTAVKAKSQIEARKILYEAQMAADWVNMNPGKKFARLKITEVGLALDDPDQILFYTPYDYLDASPLGDLVVNRIQELKKVWNKSGAEIRNAGKVTGGYTTAIFLKGIRAREWVMFKA